jgi:hypothetical protein
MFLRAFELVYFCQICIATSTSAAAHIIITDSIVSSLTLHIAVIVLFHWQQAALVLNASRRFRYTLDLKKEEEKEHIRRKIRAHAQVIRVYIQASVSAVYMFYHHTSFLFDIFVLNSIRLRYFSRNQEKSRMAIENYKVIDPNSFLFLYT